MRDSDQLLHLPTLLIDQAQRKSKVSMVMTSERKLQFLSPEVRPNQKPGQNCSSSNPMPFISLQIQPSAAERSGGPGRQSFRVSGRRKMRSRRSRSNAPPSTAADGGTANEGDGDRRTSSRTAAAAAARVDLRVLAARSPDGTDTEGNTAVTMKGEEEQQQQRTQNREQTQSDQRSDSMRKRTRTNFFIHASTDIMGTERPATASKADTVAADTRDASRSSEARSDTVGVAAGGKGAKAPDATPSAVGRKGDSSDDKTKTAGGKTGANRISRLSLTKRRAARAQAQAQTQVQAEAQAQTQKKDQANANPSPGRVKGQKYRIGSVISKDFDRVAYRGEIISYDAKARYYKVRYVEDGDEEELEEAEIERFLDPLDCSSDADSTVVFAGPSAAIDAASTGLKPTANKVEKDHDKDLAAAKPKGKTRRANTAASASSGNTIKAKSADHGSEKNRRASAQYPIGTEVSKDFGGVAYRGEVVSYDDSSRFYRIRYSDGDEEDMDTKEMKLFAVPSPTGKNSGNDARRADAEKSISKKGNALKADVKNGGRKKAGSTPGDAKKGNVKKGVRSKERKQSEAATKLSRRDEILQSAAQLAASKMSSSITAPNTNSKKSGDDKEEKETFYPGHVCRDAQFYTALNDETPFDCSEKLGCECSDLLSANLKRYKRLNAKSKLQQGTILRIPDKRDVEKVLQLYRYEDSEPPLDYCYVCLEIERPDGPDMLLCDGDGCDKACHLSCTHDKLNAVPDGDWYCKSCQDTSGTNTSTDGKSTKGEKKKRSKIKLVPKARRAKGSCAKPSASSSTPTVPSARPVTPASHDVMDSLAFLGGSTAPSSALASARGTSKVKTTSNKSHSAKSKQKQKQTKSPPRPKTPKAQESVLSSPINLPSKNLLAALDGQVAEESATSDEAPKEIGKSTAKKTRGTGTASEKKKKKSKDKNNATPNMDSIALTVEEEFKRFEQTRLKGERQTIALRIRRLKEEITSLQEEGKAAAAKKKGEKPELTLSRTKKITWKQLELKNLEGEEKRLTNRLDELSGNAHSSLSSKVDKGDGADVSTKATASDTDATSIADTKKRRSSSKKPGQKKRKRPLVSSSSDDENDSDDKPKTKAKKKAKPSAKNASTKKGSSDIQRKRDQARRKRKQLKLSRRTKSSKAGDEGDNDEDYLQVWVDDNGNDSDGHNLSPDLAPDEPPPKKKRRNGRQSGSGTGRGRGGKSIWFPCGLCLGCLQTKDCGRCRSCLERPSEATNHCSDGSFQRFICIQRQCLAPVHRARGDSSGNGDSADNALPAQAATDVSGASQEKELPMLSGGVKRRDMPALGGVKPNPPPQNRPEVPIADEALKYLRDEEHADEIESLSDGGEGIFNMSDLDDDDDEDEEALLGLDLKPGAGTSNVGIVDVALSPLHQAALPPVPQQVTVPSPLRAAGAISVQSANGSGNAAQMARDLRRRDRSTYEDEGADEWSSVGGSLGSQDDDMVELPPL